MTTIAIVPAKSPWQAKSRLARELPEHDRAAMSLDMLRAVLGQVRRVAEIAGCGVVSGDEAALALAIELGCEPLREAAGGLNQALELGRSWALQRGAEALLVLPGDVPLVRWSDIDDMLRLAQRPGIVLAPSHDRGTNALLLRPPDAIPFCFGRDSARLHRLEAARRSLSVSVLRRGTLAFDVDTPADLAAYLAVEEGLAQLDEAQRLAAR